MTNWKLYATTVSGNGSETIYNNLDADITGWNEDHPPFLTVFLIEEIKRFISDMNKCPMSSVMIIWTAFAICNERKS